MLNKNWVTVRDKCPQMRTWYERTDKRTDKRTSERVDGRTVRFYFAPNFIWGHKNRITESNIT